MGRRLVRHHDHPRLGGLDGRLPGHHPPHMNLEAVIVGAVVGVAVGWLARRWLAAARRRKAGGCAGDCGCSSKLKPKK
ncbi:MAG: FeoB-associated Cys-rich membrane protein [Verrucomicrobia bacterium]|nr:FeoB-associated Cys-rich membrane protein [Verrucomicrobiota bacterium]